MQYPSNTKNDTVYKRPTVELMKSPQNPLNSRVIPATADRKRDFVICQFHFTSWSHPPICGESPNLLVVRRELKGHDSRVLSPLPRLDAQP